MIRAFIETALPEAELQWITRSIASAWSHHLSAWGHLRTSRNPTIELQNNLLRSRRAGGSGRLAGSAKSRSETTCMGTLRRLSIGHKDNCRVLLDGNEVGMALRHHTGRDRSAPRRWRGVEVQLL